MSEATVNENRRRLLVAATGLMGAVGAGSALIPRDKSTTND
jgi:hypothetical protein